MDTLGKLLLSFGLVILMTACGSEKKKDFIDRMADEHKGDAPVKNAASELHQSGNVSGEEVVYASVGGKEVTGYLSKPEGAESNAGIIVIHEWWGLNDNIRMMADKLAGEGYTALAVDLYDGKVAESPDSAQAFMGMVNQDEAINNLTQAYGYLSDQQGVEKVGSIGWCFGGGWSLQTALALPNNIDATIIYYGQLVTDVKQLKKLQMPILGMFGAKDSGIPPSQVKAFEEALNNAKVANDIHVYEDAGHAFANPSGKRYVKEAAEDAWQRTTDFLEKYLKN